MHHHLQNVFHVQLARISQLLDRLAVWHVPPASLVRKSDLTRLLVMLARRARTKICQAKASASHVRLVGSNQIPTVHVSFVMLANSVVLNLRYATTVRWVSLPTKLNHLDASTAQLGTLNPKWALLSVTSVAVEHRASEEASPALHAGQALTM